MPSFIILRLAVAVAVLLAAASEAQAENAATAFNTGPRGATESSPLRVPVAVAMAPDSAPFGPMPNVQQPLPPDPATAVKPIVFGSQIFTGRFGSETFGGFNPDYQLAAGDRVTVRMWGAFTYDAVQTVDAQGNIFIPNVGPVPVQGVRNGELNKQVEQQVKRTFRANVGVYATLEAAQPVKVYVTGFVKAPGLYGGLSSDSVLHYLDKAGGIDPDRGSYLEVDVLRNGKPRAKFNLYKFLLDGQIASIQLQDGDTVVAYPRKHTVQVSGEVLNPYVFEFGQPRIAASELLAAARPRPGATHLSIVRKVGTERRSEYFPVSAAAEATIEDGDEVTLMSDKYPGTILVRVEGAHLGERTLVLPYGSTLQNAMMRIKPAPQSKLAALQLYRKSVAVRQKEMLNTSLRTLETAALTARSATSEEAGLRTREAELILQFVDRARKIEPQGQVILTNQQQAVATLLEDGDVLRVPEQSNLVMVSGEVLFPNAIVYDAQANAEAYVTQAGGYSQNADTSKLVVLHQNGSVAQADATSLQPGDEVMVLPRIDSKRIEITRGISQILFQIAVSAKILLGL
ncbi:MAG: polysialic acid transporter [Rhizobacter sp.]|nr:polysialic acid transporter [Rhizobacter sp.]